MSTEYAPDEIRQAFEYARAQAPELGLKLGGILGDRAHTYGYHRARAVLPSSDYSVQLAADQKGDRWAASALDLTPANADGMVTMTRRLIHAVEQGDPRLKALREFFGTVNGDTVTGRDVRTGRSVTADETHLWHLHCSGLRQYVNDADAWRAIMDVIVGNPLQEELEMDAEAKAAFAALNKRLDGLQADVDALQRGVRVKYVEAWDNNDADDTARDPHNPETLLMGIPGYVTVSQREADAAAKAKAAAAKAKAK